jgi:peroxiredoxin
MTTSRQHRIDELERRFTDLESRLEDTPEKEAISILHALMSENRRELSAMLSAGSETNEHSLDYVANLYKSAPGMEGEAENSGLPVGTRAPEFTLPDADGNLVSLSDYRGQNVVLVFYPLDWSPACSDQLSLYQAELSEFKNYGAVVLGISVDSLYSHGAWSAVRGITFPLLADFNPKGEIARKYNVIRSRDGFSERALYIIDREGMIRYSHVSSQLHHIPDIYELFEQLKSMN